MPAASKRVLVIYDFDWSLVDQNSDVYTFEVFAPHIRQQIEDQKMHVQWTDLIAQSLKAAHSEGVTRENIEESLKGLPFHPAMIRAVKNLKASRETQFTLICLSDANQVFIDTILKDKGLDEAFSAIVTNPAKWREDGLLDVSRRVDPDGTPHGCLYGCGANLCKGTELEAYLKDREQFDQMIYVGDGSNDFCPILRLRAKDFVFVRKGMGLERRIGRDGERLGLKCQVRYWGGAWECEKLFGSVMGRVDP